MAKTKINPDRKLIKHQILSDTLKFTGYFFHIMYDEEFVESGHHRIICDNLNAVLAGKLTRLIINLPPRYSKTELVKNFIAAGFSLNQRSKFIYTSYSDNLALDKSEEIRDIIRHPEHQELFGVYTKRETDSKSKWYTTAGGGVYATASGGQVVGFGAGAMNSDIFSGALVIDDPIKPEDAESPLTRERINQRYDSTLRNRINSEDTPIIIIMQRTHKFDLTGYLLDRERDTWKVLSLPALSDNDEPLWEFKHTKEDLHFLRRTNPNVFYSQYQQTPKKVKIGGEFLKDFSMKDHVKPVTYDPNQTIHISVDNNVYPYIAVTLWQLEKVGDGWKIKQLAEVPVRDPDNTASKAGAKVVKYLQSIGYNDTVYLYGDPTTRSRSTVSQENKSFIELFKKPINDNFELLSRIWKKNPSVTKMGAFVNAVLSGAMDITIEIGEQCTESIDDYISTKQDHDGSILKQRVTDPNTKISYEKNGHLTDTMKDFICQCFKVKFNKHVGIKRGGGGII